MEGRLLFEDDSQRERATRMGVEQLDKVFTLNELASGDVMFAATGVTDGAMLDGVRRWEGGAYTHSIVMRSKTGTVRTVHAEHNFQRKTWVES
jgi:fructose-1,6-bisphosphatase II / sedoheptulose-1,7-bisphosphatase